MCDFALTICHLYPGLLDLYGDAGNIASLQKRCEWRGIRADIMEVNEGQAFEPDRADIVILGGGTERAQRAVLGYAPAIAAPLREYAARGGAMLAVCEGYYMLGREYVLGGETLQGFGVLDISASPAPKRLVEHLGVEAELDGEKMNLAGFENHICEVNIGGHTPLGEVLFGFGNGHGAACEGVLYKHTVATHMHGPVLPKNPELADFLIRHALKNKYGDGFDGVLRPLDDRIELAAKVFILDRETARQAK